jgi:AraC family transcriptional regulator
VDPIIKNIPPLRIAGMHLTMSLAHERNMELWQKFMPRRKEISTATEMDFYSIRVYPQGYHFDEKFSPLASFEKWVGIAVDQNFDAPEGIEILNLPGGMYAIFNYKGLSTDSSIFDYIYGTWLPQSGFNTDIRPHYELVLKKFKNNDPDSEEDIYLPITA